MLTVSFLTIVAFTGPQRSARADSFEDILVVANRKVSVDSVTLAELQSIYLGQRKSWKKGGKIKPINAKVGSRLRSVFRKKVLGLDETRETNYWQMQKVRKTGTPPVESVNTLLAVIKNSGSVSYVFRKNYRQGLVKVLLVLPGQATGFKIVVHPDLNLKEITVSELKRIYLKERTTWSDGEPIAPVEQSPQSAARHVFTKQVHQKSVDAIENFWRQKLFAGKSTPPVQMASDAEVVNYVVSHPGAIGYVSEDAQTDPAKTVQIER